MIMKFYNDLKKYSFFILWTVIFLMVFLEFEIDKVLLGIRYYDTIFTGHRDFIINILIGIFTGMIISIMSSYIGISNFRKNFNLKMNLYAHELYNSIALIQKITNYIKPNEYVKVIEIHLNIIILAQKIEHELILEDESIAKSNNDLYCNIKKVGGIFGNAVESFGTLENGDPEFDEKFIKIIYKCFYEYLEPLENLKSEFNKTL